MKAFHTIAIPHQDILEGKLTMDAFAADLWEVCQNRGADEYKDEETFFKKTYLTQGLENLLNVVEKRLRGEGGDPVIQIQTPFGGGKTHALIAMYHKAKTWDAKKVVIVGTALSTQDTLWGLLEKQLTGSVKKFSSQVAPGKEAIRELLSAYQPVLILIDEVLEYATKAAGVKVTESTLAAQTIAFMQELTETASTLSNVCLVVTLPSSVIEHYDEGAERLFQQLQKVAGRVEKIYTPVQESEITKIIRRRLFREVNEVEVKKVVIGFIEYAEKEGILPQGLLPSEYRDRFIDSYPFMPEVVDVFYQRWGSYHTFQRTRGVLRLLSLTVHALKESDKPYISLADFDLGNQEIRQELIKHIGPEFNSVLAQDVTSVEAGSRKVDSSLGAAYQGLKLGTRVATTIFLYSFSGGPEHGATLSEIKRSATTVENPASVVAEATEQLKGKLFYLQSLGEKYFFSNQPNLNRILLNYMENVGEAELEEYERELLGESIKGDKFKVFIWEKNTGDIPDSEQLKLLILRKENKDLIEEILTNKGKTPRVYRNTIFFLYPLDTERPSFEDTVRRMKAYSYIAQEKEISLSDEQKKEVKQEIKRLEADVKEAIRRLYRMVAIPKKDGFKTHDLGIPTYGEFKSLDQEVYDELRTEGEILEKIVPLVLKEKYLADKEYVLTENLYKSSLTTRGEARPVSITALEEGIAEGVRMGHFGLGELEDGKPVCRYFKESPSIAFSGSEVIVREDVCKEQREKEEEAEEVTYELSEGREEELLKGKIGEEASKLGEKVRYKVHLKCFVPKGKVASLMGVMNLLQSKFENLEIELRADNGAISEQDYEDKILEAFRQMGIDLDE